MRLVKIDKLKEGDIIGEDILSESGGVLLRAYSIFKETYRRRFKNTGIQAVFIDDEISKGVEPVYAISRKVRESMIRDMKKEISKLKENVMLDIEVIEKISHIFLEEISRSNLVCEMIDLRASETNIYEHSIAVAIMTTMVCIKLNLMLDQTQKIVSGALLHDIGKIQLPQELFQKEILSKEDEECFKTHADLGYKMIKEKPEVSPLTKLIVLCHHEREDGLGYPLGKKEELHIGAKIVGTCDYYQHLMMKGLPITHAMLKGKAEKFDPQVRKAVEGILAFYPVGSLVKLSTGDMAIVEKNFAEALHRPQVKVIKSLEDKCETNIKINLQQEDSITIISKIEQIA